VYRHPVQLYEALLGALVLAGIVFADRAWGKEQRPRGALIALAATLYFAGRFVLEFAKEYQALAQGSLFTMGQWLSLPCALLAAWLLWRSLGQRLPAGWVATARVIRSSPR
jgi:prolipoprotein diacylglyceryltransferase